jgi:Tol biopolymer transport system component
MPAVAPDGRTLVFARSGSETDLDLWMAPLSEGSPLSVAKASAKPLVALDGPQRAPVFSADGRYLSYESFTAPSWGVFVTRFPGGDGRWEVAGGVGSQGAALRWGARGDRLYYLNRAYEIVEADITTIPAFTIRSSRVLSRISLGGVTIGDAFDRSPDDTKFLVTLTNAPPGTDSRVVVIESWAAARR